MVQVQVFNSVSEFLIDYAFYGEYLKTTLQKVLAKAQPKMAKA